MRLFGLVILIGFGLLGALSIAGWWRRGQDWRLILGILLTMVGLTIFVWSLVSPRTLPPVYDRWMAFGLRIGDVVTSVLLSAAYFLIVAPVGWMMRKASGDPLDRSIARDSATYWRARSGVPDPTDYQHMS